jgi:hypothetical protein
MGPRDVSRSLFAVVFGVERCEGSNIRTFFDIIPVIRSTMVCIPTSLSQEVGAVLGAQVGEARLREVIMGAGFRSVRRATETPFNVILEARS